MKERQRMLLTLEIAQAACMPSLALDALTACRQARDAVKAMLGYDPYEMGETEKQISDMITSVMKFMTEDIVNCYNGGATACVSFVASFIPGEKLAVGFGRVAAKVGGKLGSNGKKVAQKFADGVEGAIKGCSSFVPGTKVLMADGTYERIEQIEVGDRVVAADPVTGKPTPETVLGLIATQGDKNLIQLTITSKGKNIGVIIATAQHPFWAGRPGHWLTAGELAPGMWLRTSSGAYTQIAAITQTYAHHQAVHNLTIDGPHTYYVSTGDVDVLVHNAPGCGSGLRGASAGLKGLFDGGSVFGKSINQLRAGLLKNGFTQGLTRNKKGYLFRNAAGEEVRIMRRNGGWDIRIRNKDGNFLNEFGDVDSPNATHNITVGSF